MSTTRGQRAPKQANKDPDGSQKEAQKAPLTTKYTKTHCSFLHFFPDCGSGGPVVCIFPDHRNFVKNGLAAEASDVAHRLQGCGGVRAAL